MDILTAGLACAEVVARLKQNAFVGGEADTTRLEVRHLLVLPLGNYFLCLVPLDISQRCPNPIF